MLRWMILKKLDAVERELGESMDYLRYVARHSIGACLKFSKVMPLASYRRKLPPGPYHIAHIVAARSADCGACTQIGINVARKTGIADDVLRAVIEQSPEKLPEDLALAYRFAEAVTEASPDLDALREAFRARFGDEGLIEMSFAIAVSRVFPETKLGLGFATSCARYDLRL